MSRSRLVFLFASFTLVLAIVSGTLFGAGLGQPESSGSLYKYLSVFTEVLSLVRQAYVDETSPGDLVAGALDGASDALDAFSAYVPAAEAEEYLASRRVGTARSGLTVLKERGIAYVVAVAADSPAAVAGVEAGDLVAALDGESTRRMPLWRIHEILAGEPGTTVELEVLRQGETKELAVELAPYPPAAAAIAERDGVPVLRIPAFGPATPEQVAGLVEEVVQPELVVDLRGVAGGDIEAAYRVAELFAGGELGRLASRGEAVQTFRGALEPRWRGEVVVLIDRGTQGPAEVLAAVLRQAASAQLVGQRSFGFAGHQEVAVLADGGRLVYTRGFYTGPDGQPLSESLSPDLLVEEDLRTFAEQPEPREDEVLERGIELLRKDGDAAKKVA